MGVVGADYSRVFLLGMLCYMLWLEWKIFYVDPDVDYNVRPSTFIDLLVYSQSVFGYENKYMYP